MRRRLTGIALTGAMAAVLAASVAWGAGFTWFNHLARQPAPPPPEADGIVALTGGADRIDTALRLLMQGKAPALLISGVGRGTDLTELMHRSGADREPHRVTLGRLATSTAGNAAETAAWVRAQGVRRLIVVTAGYHMPRALLEIGRALPEVALYPAPVLPPALRGPADLGTLRIMASEYDKLLAVRLGWTWLRGGEG